MPLFQIGYRRYEGTRTSTFVRWWPITRSGVTIAWRSKLLRRLVYVSFVPFLYFGWIFFLIGRITDPSASGGSEGIDMIISEMMGPEILRQLKEDPTQIRSAVWSIVFATFGTNFQLLIGGLVAAIVGPRLVANDIQSKSFLIYFSRPISRLDYILGKLGVLIAMLAAVTLVPSAALYAISILFSPSIDTLVQTAPVALSMGLASLGTIIPAALLALAVSSMTSRPRFATAVWIVICVFGPIAHGVLQQTKGLADSSWTFLLSLPHSVRALQLGLYDVEGQVGVLQLERGMDQVIRSLTVDNSPTTAAIWLGSLSILSLLLLFRRADAPTRI